MSETDEAPGPAAPRRRIWPFVLVAAVAAAATVGLAFVVITNGMGDREPAGTGERVVDLDATSYSPADWGQYYPYQYERYQLTAEITPTRHVSAWQPSTQEERTTTPAVAPAAPAPAAVTYPDERDTVAPSKLVEDPRLKTLFAGYAFSKDYRHVRGHEWMLTDQQQTLRVLALADGPSPQPGSCANCHSSIVPIVDALGDGADKGTGLNAAGWAAMNQTPYTELQIEHGDAMTPIACIDCHDPETRALRITRPALVEGMRVLKASEGIEGYDVNQDATHQEMRSLVCAQCHVEYYFKGPERTLTYPWHNGTDINGTWDYYAAVEITGADGKVTTGFTDYTNGISGAKTLKAQHPEYEAWSQGIHAEIGVTCADCHMNYVRRDGRKVSNHRIASPMAEVTASCGMCHTGSTAQLELRVTTIQGMFVENRDTTLAGVVGLVESIGAAVDGGMPENDPRIGLARQYQGLASYYLDYAYSANSYGFHAPAYFERILGQSAEAVRNGELALLGVPQAQLVPLAELSAVTTLDQLGAGAASG
ncbi:MAG: ammonia-forming cytochrome c nitrite reductase subunit c552 [Micrococcales bacterium]|nr:ammonia-forming cytochrome c nitrite reductase subunit c552 [Micrococcales bacterium]